MIWGGKRIDGDFSVIKERGKVKYLLFLNEPDRKDQANMSVEEAIHILGIVRNLADQISSPACAGGINEWCKNFLEKARERGHKLDFLAIHLYTPPHPEMFLKKLDEIYNQYKLPIWITEFAVADWKAKKEGRDNKYTEEEVLNFMQRVLPELERRPYIVRYAWFGAGKDCYQKEQIRTSCLFDKEGNLTKVGKYYSDFKWKKK